MTYPTTAVTTTNLDASTDSPASARSDILDAIQKLNQMIAHTTAFAATLLDDANAATARGTLGLSSTDSPTFAGLTVPSINGGPLAGLRNAIINGNFGVNQRAVSGTVTLAAGAYGHDRFKAGASGCTYTFATSANVTTLTISAGSLQQVIEGVNLQSGTYTLSWAGTAQGKIGAGSYAASGVTGAATGGTNLTVEFGTGTLAKVQLEFGLVATVFEHNRPYGMELALCQRYYYRMQSNASQNHVVGFGWAASATMAYVYGNFPVRMRIIPASVETSGTAGDYLIESAANSGYCSSIPVIRGIRSETMWSLFYYMAGGLVAGQAAAGAITSSTGYLGFPAEL